jgi:hypothetical protein
MTSNPAKIAIRDIKKHIELNFKDVITYNGKGFDTWYCFGESLYNKEQRRLNKSLGLWGINKSSNNMTRKTS